MKAVRMVSLVGGPLCGTLVQWACDEVLVKIGYYGGVAEYRSFGDGEAWYVGG